MCLYFTVFAGRGESEGQIQSWEGVKIVAVTAKKHVEFEITR